jgi:hypothetical protein
VRELHSYHKDITPYLPPKQWNDSLFYLSCWWLCNYLHSLKPLV